MKKKNLSCIVLNAAGLSLVLFGIQSSRIVGTTVEAATVPGTGTLSGTVKASKPFQAAQVYARNVEKDVVYMVYTVGGRYQAVNLFPGDYEVSVQTKGLAGDAKKVVVSAGANATADFTLRESAVTSDGVPRLSYNAMYPQGAGRDLAEKTCIACHGASFLTSHHWSESQWETALDLMSGPENAFIPPGTLSPKDRQDLLAYLTKNFGPDSPKRELEAPEVPVDEQALAKAMYVEYHLPRDGKHQVKAPYFDNDGNAWFGDNDALTVTMLDPRTVTYRSFPVPERVNSVAVDAEGHVWWAGNVFMGRIEPKTGEHVQYRADPKNQTNGKMTLHTNIVDSKQNIWFTDIVGNTLGRWDRKTGEMILYEAPTPNSRPYGITRDKNDNIWFAESSVCKVAMFNPETEKFTEYSGLTPPCDLRRLGVDSKGTVWYSVKAGAKLGKIDTRTGQIVEYDVPNAHPYDVWPDREDNIWIGNGGEGGVLIKFDPRTEKFTYYPSPQTHDIPKVEITRDGAVWYATRSGAKENMAVGVLYPDVTKMTTLGAYY